MKIYVVVLAVLFGLGAHAADESTLRDGDLGRLQGRWIGKAGARHEIDIVLEIKGRGVAVSIKTPKGLDVQVEGEVRVDETTAPRSLNWIKFTGPGQQPLPEIAAVYKLEGNTFTVRNGGLRGKRPRAFEPGDAPLDDLLIFRRLGPDGAMVGSSATSGSAGPAAGRQGS